LACAFSPSFGSAAPRLAVPARSKNVAQVLPSLFLLSLPLIGGSRPALPRIEAVSKPGVSGSCRLPINFSQERRLPGQGQLPRKEAVRHKARQQFRTHPCDGARPVGGIGGGTGASTQQAHRLNYGEVFPAGQRSGDGGYLILQRRFDIVRHFLSVCLESAEQHPYQRPVGVTQFHRTGRQALIADYAPSGRSADPPLWMPVSGGRHHSGWLYVRRSKDWDSGQPEGGARFQSAAACLLVLHPSFLEGQITVLFVPTVRFMIDRRLDVPWGAAAGSGGAAL